MWRTLRNDIKFPDESKSYKYIQFHLAEVARILRFLPRNNDLSVECLKYKNILKADAEYINSLHLEIIFQNDRYNYIVDCKYRDALNMFLNTLNEFKKELKKIRMFLYPYDGKLDAVMMKIIPLMKKLKANHRAKNDFYLEKDIYNNILHDYERGGTYDELFSILSNVVYKCYKLSSNKRFYKLPTYILPNFSVYTKLEI